MNNLCIDVGHNSLKKFGEELCGDHINVIQNNQNSIIMVLADGLGSGVKANILSTLTAKIISTMMEQSMPIEDCVNTIASTLPVCKDGETAYSTFTIIKITDSVNAEIIQYDNPKVILLRDGENSNYSIVEMTIENKKILYSKIVLKENDMLVSMSDGALHAGVESELNYNWKRDNIIDFLQIVYEQDFTAKTMTTILLDQCNKLYGEKPSDDTTVCTIKIRKRKALNLLFGPPSNYDDDEKMMTEFFSKKGLHVVCGGTTSQIAARFLGEEISENLLCLDPEIPPTAKIRGIELVTEGVITINKVLLYSENYLQDNEKFKEWAYKKDGASLIARMLFEDSTDINFFVGKAINPANQNPDQPIDHTIKVQLIEKLTKNLKSMGKKVRIKYF